MQFAFRLSEKLPFWMLLAEGGWLLADVVVLPAKPDGILALEPILPAEQVRLLAERDLLEVLIGGNSKGPAEWAGPWL